jgi:hypothetical protein
MRRGARLIFLVCLLPLAAANAARGAEPAQPLSPALVEAWYTSGTLNGEEWGAAVAGAGDLNGDGYDDILIGAPKYGPNREGGAFVYYGGAAGLAKDPGWMAMGEKGSRFGTAVAGVGDVNCDGYPDIAVGAPEYNNGTTTAGAVFVYYGSAGGFANTSSWSHVSAQGGANVGYAVAGAGDANGDGCDDLLVGARRYTDVENNEGALILFYGTSGGPGTDPDWMVESNQLAAGLGSAVAGLGDVNGDGYADFAGGAPFWNSSEALDAGAVFVFYGNDPHPDTTPARHYEGAHELALLGWSVAGANVNGDGYGDLAAGMPGFADAASGRYGAALLFHGGAAGLGETADRTLYGDQPASGYGRAVAGAGDVNADGYGDLIVGANAYTGDQSKEGAVFLHLGGAGGVAPAVAWMGEGNKADTDYGSVAAGAGDVNGDGCDDFLVGAPLFRMERVIVGRAYAYHGTEGSLFYTNYLPFLTAAP